MDVATDLFDRWAHHSVTVANHYRGVLNALNVYPVADADTGTNVVTTLTAAYGQLTRFVDNEPVSVRAQAWAQAAVEGARGNSGIILAQWLSKVVADWPQQLTADQLHMLLTTAAEAAYDAVAHPVVGTMVSLARDLASFEVEYSEILSDYLFRLCEHGYRCVEKTTAQLPELSKAGVVDAGAFALWLVVVSLYETVTGTAWTVTVPEVPGDLSSGHHQIVAVCELHFRLTVDADITAHIHTALDQFGDSLAIAVVKQHPNVCHHHIHIHTNFPDEVVAAASGLGKIAQVEQSPLIQGSPCSTLAVIINGEQCQAAVKEHGAWVWEAVAAGDDCELWLERQRAHCGIGVDQPVSIAVSTPQQYQVVCAGLNVVSPLHGAVRIIECDNPVHALAAVSVHDRHRTQEQDLDHINRAVQAIRVGQIVPDEAGQLRVLLDSQTISHAGDYLSAVKQLLPAMLTSNTELVTVVIGQQIDCYDDIVNYLSQTYPHCQHSIFVGGHEWALSVGAE